MTAACDRRPVTEEKQPRSADVLPMTAVAGERHHAITAFLAILLNRQASANE